MKYINEYNSFKSIAKTLSGIEAYFPDGILDIIQSIFSQTDIIIENPEDISFSNIAKFVKYKNDVIFNIITSTDSIIHHDDLVKFFKRNLFDINVQHGVIDIRNNIQYVDMSGYFTKNDLDIVINSFNENIRKNEIFDSIKSIDKNKLFINTYLNNKNIKLDSYNIRNISYKDFIEVDISSYAYQLFILFAKNLDLIKEFDFEKIKHIYPTISDENAVRVVKEINDVLVNKKIMNKFRSAEYRNLSTKYKFTESKEN